MFKRYNLYWLYCKRKFKAVFFLKFVGIVSQSYKKITNALALICTAVREIGLLSVIQ